MGRLVPALSLASQLRTHVRATEMRSVKDGPFCREVQVSGILQTLTRDRVYLCSCLCYGIEEDDFALNDIAFGQNMGSCWAGWAGLCPW